MKRMNSGEGFAVMNKDHWEKNKDCLETSDLKYAQSDVDNEPEIKRNADALASYVKSNRMKY
jgi:hypothetical protein